MMNVEHGELLYANPLSAPSDVADFHLEGEGAVTFPLGRMRLEGTREPGNDDNQLANQKANIVYWCPHEFPDNIVISWDFYPIREPGLCILFFAASAQGGGSVLGSALAPRDGQYDQYHHGDINALHLSYFRRRYAHERAFHTCNLRKSYGFHLVAQGPDPLPDVADAQPPYCMTVVKHGPAVRFNINGFSVLEWHDTGTDLGPVLGGGQLGFRQMTPLIAEYANLQVHAIAE